MRNLMFWKSSAARLADLPKTDTPPTAAAASAGPQGPGRTAEVIDLASARAGTPSAQGLDQDYSSLEAASPDSELAPTSTTAVRFKGLLNAPELETFFNKQYFAYGRYNGSRFRTREALEGGCKELIAKFQNTAAELVERRQARLDKLQQARLDVETLSIAMADKLRMAGEQVAREMAVLWEQIALAEDRKGWVLEAVNRYQLGFDRGVREALDFELLNA